MAGTYPDIPGTRFALDQDGTVMKWRDSTASSAWTDVTSSILLTQTIDSASFITVPVGGGNLSQVAVAFPEPRSVSGLYLHVCGNVGYDDQATGHAWEYSTDTTDGTDGTWTAFTVNFTYLSYHNTYSAIERPYYRNDISPVTLSNVKGIRIKWRTNQAGYGGTSNRIYVLHIYGTRAATSVDRLAFWHPTLDQPISAASLDFGDIPQGYSGTRQFRIKNLSATLTANGVDVQLNDPGNLYDATELEVSNDNVTFAGSISIGNIAPGTISSIKYLKRTVPSNEAPTLNNARLLTNATSWT